jgi:hypothetical protein
VLLALLVLVLSGPSLWGQEYGARLGTVQRGGKVSYEPTGPGVIFDALDPALRKWYVPQELVAEYRWKQWEYDNYARQPYQRYVSTSLEGEYFYDSYGNYLTRGWLIYDWQQINPQPFGSNLTQSNLFGAWFNHLVVASDHKGQYHYAITVGREIRTTLTPMTFSKPLFNGIQWDFATDKYQATLLLSRISDPNSFLVGGEPRQITDNSNLLGGRVEVQVGDFVKVGGTFVNARHSHSRSEAFNDNMFKGNLLSDQNATTLTAVEILVSDDSPDDGEGGGALFASDILIYDIDGSQTRGSEIGFRALVEGGIQRRGFLAADGFETIRLRFDFSDPAYTGPDPSRIERVRLELVLANDYRVDMASDRQTNSAGTPVFLLVQRAVGNVKDGSNQRVLAFDYGLPTANQIAGLSVAVDDLAGLKAYFEYNVNHRFRQYPNPQLRQHRAADFESRGWMFTVEKKAYPLFAYAEAFDIDPDYATSFATVDINQNLSYDNQLQLYEFVEDNDDQDRRPDWRRKGWGNGDDEVFPGWDENNDFVSDFNQNDNEITPNRIPDYAEPFLRYYSDRPEFLYGVDMNNNGTIDRFENDQEADLPYKRDRRGYNAYAGSFLGEGARVTLGHTGVRQRAEKRRSRAGYALFTVDKSGASWGRVRLFQDLRRVRDDIRDDLLQWLQPPNTRGDLFPVDDPLPARDAWVNTSWLGWDWRPLPGLSLSGKSKWQVYRRLATKRRLALRDRRQHSAFFGLINKADYRFQWRGLTLTPAWKSEFLSERPTVASLARRRELSELFMGLMRFKLLRSSFVELGAEYLAFVQLRDPTPPGAEDSFRELVTAAQLTNISDYLGYRLTTVVGFELSRRRFDAKPDQTSTRGFLTVFAGVER